MADTKVVNFLASTYEGDVGTLAVIVERAASIPFAASGEYYQSLVHGPTAATRSRTHRAPLSASTAATSPAPR